MKNHILLFSLLLLFTQCEKPSDCIKSTGPMKSKVYTGLSFTKLLVKQGIAVVIIQGNETTVEVRSGENLIGDIDVKVEGDYLVLSDETSCNWVRDYGETTVYVTAPNLTEIHSKTGLDIVSNGILAFPSLHLFLMDTVDGFSGTGTGDIRLQVNNETIIAENNEMGRFFISGHTKTLTINFAENGGVFRGENLYADAISFYHRGSNDLHLRPVNSLIGAIYSVGDVYCYGHPPLVDVTEYYRGDLIYR